MYTETQKKGNKEYYYRVKSVRNGKMVKKMRKYLGTDLSKKELKKLETEADKLLSSQLNKLLTKEELKTLKQIKEKYSGTPKSTGENRYEAFLAQFTYDTNAIEGNTLTLRETANLLFEQRTPPNKTLREINEALNHKKAFDFLLDYKGEINKKIICTLQKLIVTNTLREDLEPQIGKYRTLQVYIRGANFIPPKPKEVKKEMKDLQFWYSRNKHNLHPLIIAAYHHAAFESIHPFVDGNGRTGRLLINLILHKNKYPMINIPNSRKLTYYACLEAARKGDLRKLVKFLYEIMVSTEVYI
ncbi:MAG: Fic family protein [archaeon]